MESTPVTPRHRQLGSNLRPISVSRASSASGLHHRRSAYLTDLLLTAGASRHEKAYDGDYKTALLRGEVGNGVRTWYSSFTTIDWLHDICKEDFRLRELRSRPGLRGVIANNWDRLQGWVAVIVIGLFTALIAFLIITFEMFLFHLKDGYCSAGWWRSKRACRCVATAAKESLLQPTGKSTLIRSAVAGNAFVQNWSRRAAVDDDNRRDCDAWKQWSSMLDSKGSHAPRWALEYGIYIVMALAFATFASFLTLWLSASDTVVSAKDIVQPSQTGEESTLDGEREHPPRTSRSTIPRSFSYTNYGSVPFSPSTTMAERRGSCRTRTHSTSHRTSIDEASPLLGQSQLPELKRTDTNLSRTGKSFNAAMAPTNGVGGSDPPQTLAPRKTMYFAAGSGIPEIKTLLSGFVIRGYLGGWTLLAKAIGLCFSVGSGLSLGKEGPFVHIASCVGNITSRFFPKFDRNEAKRRELLSAACAAGVAVSFGAPVGGVLFSLEEVSYFFPPKVMFRSFVCAMIAATTLKAFNPFGTGKIVLFEVTYDKDWHFVELLGFAILGVFGGLYGAMFNKANIAWTKYVRNGTSLKKHPVVEVALVVLLTSIVSFLNPLTKMGGTELVYEMFSECSRDDDLDGLCVRQPSQVGALVLNIAFALVTKALLTVITFGIKLPAGIFIPTLAVGACFGRLLGLLVELAYAHYPASAAFGFCRASGPLPAPFGQACVLPGVWAMVGAAATLAGVTRTTVSLAVIMFELTGTLTYVTPVMLAVLFSKTTADYIEGRSIYDLVIELNQLPYLDAKEEYILEGTVMDVVDMDAPVLSLEEENTVASLTDKLAEHEGLITGFPILLEDDGLRLQGYIGYDEVEEAVRTYEASSTASESPAEEPPVTGSTPPDAPSPRVTFQDVRLDQSSAAASSGVLDLGYLVDRGPMTVSSRAPLQLLHQLFIKLGVRYLAVQDERGCYVGIIEKNRWLGYLKWLESEHKGHAHRKGASHLP